jgi:tetratricopeptide (TPR) repeat protein
LEEAIEQYRRALETAPDNAVAHYSLANSLAARGRLDEAITHYRQALEISPHLREARARLDESLAATNP